MTDDDVAEATGESDHGCTAGRPSLAARPLLFVVRIYQATLRPFLGGHCRFYPTCSDYAAESLLRHGAVRGSWLTARRLLRCHPFGGAGHDPVPTGEAKKRGLPPFPDP